MGHSKVPKQAKTHFSSMTSVRKGLRGAVVSIRHIVLHTILKCTTDSSEGGVMIISSRQRLHMIGLGLLGLPPAVRSTLGPVVAQPTSPTYYYASASAVNGKGQISGLVMPGPGKARAVYWLDVDSYPVNLVGLPGNGLNSAADINDAAQVVGSSRPEVAEGPELPLPGGSGVLWTDDNVIELSPLDGNDWCECSAISNTSGRFGREVLVGSSGNQLGGSRATSWLDEPIEMFVPSDATESRANGLNNIDFIVGDIWTPTTGWYAVGWIGADGWFVEFEGLSGDPESHAYDVNDNSQVVGSSWKSDGPNHAVMWYDGETIDLGVLPGYLRSEAYAINNSGMAVGVSFPNRGHSRATLWHERDMIDLGVLDGDVGSRAVDINDSGLIVGESFSADFVGQPVFWRDGEIAELLVPS